MIPMIDSLAVLCAKYLYIIALLIAGFFFLKLSIENKKRLIIFALVAFPIIYVIAIIVGHLYYDPRPFVVGHFTPLIPHDPDNGFPSDHALLLSAVASIFYPLNKRYSLILWTLTVVVAISRVYVGIHHFVDVIGSMIISIFITGLVYLIIDRFSNGRQKN